MSRVQTRSRPAAKPGAVPVAARPASWSPAWTIALILIALATAAIHYAEPVRDGDLFFHLAYGRYFLEHHTLIPDHTAFSWSPTDGKNIYCAWIPEIFFYLAHQAGGYAPLFAFTYLCLLVFVAATLWMARRLGVLRHPLVGVILLLGLLMSDSAAYNKPEIFSYVFLVVAVTLWALVKTAGERAWKLVYGFPVLMLLWVNSHGGYIFGVLFLALMFAGETVNRRFAPSQALPARVWKHLSYAMALSALAILVTPYGIRYPLHLLTVFSKDSPEDWGMVRAYLSIFDSRAQHLFYVPYFAIVIGLFALAAWGKPNLRRIDWALLLPNLGLAFVYTRYLRSTYYWAPVLAIGLLLLLSRRRGPLWAARPRWAAYAIGAVFLIGALALSTRATYQSICRPTGTRWCGFGVSYQNPVDEAEFIRTHFAGRRLGNDYGGGAYLLWKLYPKTKVMVDPRGFPYRSWISRYQALADAKDMPGFLKDFPAEVWCVNHSYERLTAWFLRQPDWKLAYYGPSSAVFARSDIPIPEMEDRSAESIARISNASQALFVFRFAMAISDWDTSSQILARMRSHFPCSHTRAMTESMEDLYAGTRAYYDENYPEAIRRLEKCRAGGAISDPNLLVNAYYRVIASSWSKHDERAAYASAQAALAVRPDDPIALYNAGVIGWYVEAQAGPQGGRAAGADATGLSLAPVAGSWRDPLRRFLKVTENQPINPTLTSVASKMLQGEYAERPSLVMPR